MKASVVSVVGMILFAAWAAFPGGDAPPFDGPHAYSRSGIEVRFESDDGVPSGEFADAVRRIVQGEGLVPGNPGGYVGTCVVRIAFGGSRAAFACQSFGREQGLREFFIGSEAVPLEDLHTALSTFFSAVDAEMAKLPMGRQWNRLLMRDKTASLRCV